jgi:CRISPR system Cascade subunit CasC
MFPRFIQIHTLTAFPGALLNRDDVGFAKRITFGGAVRTRVSSQCLKRHWRTFDGKGAISEVGLPDTVRSRQTFERCIVQPLVEEGVSRELAAAAATAVRDKVLGGTQEKTEAKAKGKKGAEAEAVGPVLTGQVTVLGQPEIAHLLDLTRRLCAEAGSAAKVGDAAKTVLGKDEVANLKALRLAGGVGAALFGRMVTSDILARGDAAIHVAHAFTVHAEETETDYFSAIDDLVKDDGELGSGHIGNTELTSGLYYSYVVVDLPLLIANLEGGAAGQTPAERANAAEIVERLIKLMATVSPGAKKGSTAPYANALAVLVEVGDDQPRTLANAFLQPVSPRGGVLANTYRQLGDHLQQMDRIYEVDGGRRFVGVDAPAELAGRLGAEDAGSLKALAGWVKAQVVGGA